MARLKASETSPNHRGPKVRGNQKKLLQKFMLLASQAKGERISSRVHSQVPRHGDQEDSHWKSHFGRTPVQRNALDVIAFLRILHMV